MEIRINNYVIVCNPDHSGQFELQTDYGQFVLIRKATGRVEYKPLGSMVFLCFKKTNRIIFGWKIIKWSDMKLLDNESFATDFPA